MTLKLFLFYEQRCSFAFVEVAKYFDIQGVLENGLQFDLSGILITMFSIHNHSTVCDDIDIGIHIILSLMRSMQETVKLSKKIDLLLHLTLAKLVIIIKLYYEYTFFNRYLWRYMQW